MSTTTYTSPVDKLLTLGKPESTSPESWPNYLELGLGPEHIPELIHMATDHKLSELEEDEDEDPDYWAPLHAIRALGQLHAESAIEPLVNLLGELNEDEWMLEELPLVFGMLGPAAIPALSAYLADTSHEMYPRSYASNGITEIAGRYPESREECIAIISKQLENFEENNEELNAFLVTNLLQIKAVETLSLIERAFKADKVDDFIVNLDDVLVGFGLKEREIVDNPFLEIFKEISASRAEQKETSSSAPEESYLLPPPPARSPSYSSDKIIKFSGKRVTKKKGKKKR
jgi:hypothetical protein